MVREEFNYSYDTDNYGNNIIYIDNTKSENTYGVRDLIKKYGAKWDGFKHRWYWTLPKDEGEREMIVNSMVLPAVEELTRVEKQKEGSEKRMPEDVSNEVKEAIYALTYAEKVTKDLDIKKRMEAWREELINITSGEEFMKIMEPVIKFKNATGHEFSWTNSLLIFIQFPKAKMVKSKTRWNKVNRVVVDQKHPIVLRVPILEDDDTLSADEITKGKNAVITKFLNNVGKKSIKDLTPGQKEELEIQKDGVGKAFKGFKFVASFYDISQTKQMRGKKDLVGSMDSVNNIPWFTEAEPDEKSVQLYDAMTNVILNSGVKIEYVDSLNGARGVSTSGLIKLLKIPKKDIGTVDTMIHEFSHEILHQKYLKQNNEDFKNYFIGTDQGRAVVEQQAELSAWIVLRSFGYNLNTDINYIGIWGLNKDNAGYIFDSVGNCATKIIQLLEKELKRNKPQSLNESVGSGIVSGLDVAKLLGNEAVNAYIKSKEKEEKEMYMENFNKLCNF